MKINEVSKKFNLSIATLRYYESIGLIEKVHRINGIRDYQEEDIERIDFILCMKSSGLSLEAMKEYFELYRQGGVDTLVKRKEILENQQQKILKQMKKLEKSYAYVDFKIKRTIDKIAKETT